MKKCAFHWSRNDDCLGYGDGRQIALGETLSVSGKPELCNHGLHGSESIVDALGYAAGSHLWVVEIWGNVDNGNDKLCGNHRKAVVEYGDLLPVIVEFTFWCSQRGGEYTAEQEKLAQENWRRDKLSQIK